MFSLYHAMSIQSDVADSQIDSNSTQKKYLLLEINTIKKSLLFRIKYIIDGGCLFDDWFFIILIFITDI